MLAESQIEDVAEVLKYRELNFKHMDSPTEFTNTHMLKEEFVPMHSCGVGPRKIKLLAGFSVSLQTVYTTWKDYTMES